MTRLDLRKLLSQGELEIVAKELNYTSDKLDEYKSLENQKKDSEQQITYFLDLGDEITKELLDEMDRIGRI